MMKMQCALRSMLRIALLAAILVAATAAAAHAAERFCTSTASAQKTACRSEVTDDYYVAKAICTNLSNDDERAECFADATSGRKEGLQECSDQRAARVALCDQIGEGRYDPDIDPANFDEDFHNLTHPNPYYPLGIGNVWEYESPGETDHVEVLDETKLIEGVTCIVVRDVVSFDGGGSENTNDWFAHRTNGTVDYFGEESKDLEVFPGDVPMNPELVSIEGSFKAGRDGDKSGTIFLANPAVGDTYRQEWSASNAEDAATVLSIDYGYGSDPDLDQFVPADLANHLCADHDCVVTADFTPTEPDVVERKYYAREIGTFLEVSLETGEVTRLVGCNFDARCASLPNP